MPMRQVLCDSIPVGDILTRQPKTPGQKSTAVVQRIPATPVMAWANQTKDPKVHRCTRCASTSHIPGPR